jgi:hypothetical protein
VAIVLRTLLGNVADLIAADFDLEHVQAWIVSNAPDQAIVDKTNNRMLLGAAPVAIEADGDFSIANIVDFANVAGDVQPTGIQYELFISYRDHGTGESKTWRSGQMQVTANNQQVAAILGSGSTVAPAYQSQFIRKDLVDAKGDLLVATGADVVARRAVGSNGARLVADSAQADGLRWSTARFFEGTGSPEGVVTAPPGSEYVDAAATMGAVKWVKASGTGNTGWKVTYGDTGKRQASSLLNGWTASYVRLGRVGNLVALRVEGLSPTGSSSGTFFNVPSGFRPFDFYAMGVTMGSGSIAVPRMVAVQGDGSVFADRTGGDALYGELVYMTRDPWPTSLPGTAV